MGDRGGEDAGHKASTEARIVIMSKQGF